MKSSGFKLRAGAASLFLIVFLLTAFAAADLWYDAYESGVRAFQSGNLQLAEQKLKAALKAQPTQGRRIKAYGTKFIRYMPEYYLGLINIRQGRYPEGLKQLESAQASRLVGPSDPEYNELKTAAQLAQERLTPKVPEKSSPEAVASTGPQSDTTDLLRQSGKSTADIPAETAKKEIEAREASPPAADTNAIHETENRIDHAKEKESTARNEKAESPAPAIHNDAELDALTAYYSGDYARAITLFQDLARDNPSARIQFYLGCSYAALGLIQGREGQDSIRKAQEYFARARKLNASLQVDSRYISPRVLQMYQNTPAVAP